MAQQINLYSPILMAPRRYFSALAMVQALLGFTLVLAALCAWVVASNAALRRELQSSVQAQAGEREHLTQALAAQPAASGVALEQELAQSRQSLAARRALLAELTRGRLAEGRSHAAMLRMVAQTVPPPVWLTDIRLVEGRLELNGLTLQPDALRPWLAQLAVHRLTAEQRLATVRLERVTAASAITTAHGNAALPEGTEAWAFQLVSQTVPAPGSDLATPGAKP